MKDFTKLNANQITSIKSYIKQEFPRSKVEWYEFRPKGFLCKERKAGFYFMDWTNFSGDLVHITEKEIIEKYKDVYIENNIVYYKPYVSIKMSSDEKFNIHFDSEYYLNEFMQLPEIVSLNWIAVK